MKKIFLLFLISISSYGQAVFEEGIQVTGGQPTVTTVNYLPTVEADGLFAKINPVLLPLSTATINAINTSYLSAVNKTADPQTKIGGFTAGGVNRTYASDQWLAFGTSVTFNNTYTKYASKQLNVTQVNYGISGSTSADLVNHYSEIPTLNSGNQNQYRFLSFEYGLNDANTSVPLATFRANLEAGIANAKGKNWANNKILIINGNYCSSAPLNTTFLPYANEAILIAKEQGVQYYDAYNYTLANGFGTITPLLNVDGIHPTDSGGVVYARGLVASMEGGGEFSNALSVNNGIVAGNIGINMGTTTPNGNVFRAVGDGDINGTFKSTSFLPFTPNISVLGNASNYFLSAFIQNGNITTVASNALRTNIIRSGSAAGTDYTNTAGTVIVAKMYDNGHWSFQNGSTYNDDGWLVKIKGTNALLTTDMTFITAPTASAGAYSLLSVNDSTLKVEKIASTTFAPNILTGYVSVAGTVLATDTPLQAIQKLNGNDALKADLVSPALTGTPTAPTAAPGTNTNQVATMAALLAAVTGAPLYGTLSGSASLDFPSTIVGASTDLQITVTGAVVGDVVSIGVPLVSVVPNGIFTAFVGDTDLVTIRFSNLDIVSANNPGPGTFKVKVLK